MQVGLLTAELYFPQCQSLKDKRMLVRSVKERIRTRFNVSVAEVDFQDKWQRCQLVVGVVASNGGNANSELSKVMRLLEKDGRYQMLNLQISYL